MTGEQRPVATSLAPMLAQLCVGQALKQTNGGKKKKKKEIYLLVSSLPVGNKEVHEPGRKQGTELQFSSRQEGGKKQCWDAWEHPLL